MHTCCLPPISHLDNVFVNALEPQVWLGQGFPGGRQTETERRRGPGADLGPGGDRQGPG